MKSILLMVIGLFIISCNDRPTIDDHLNLSNKLSGKWKAKAFTGELHETWNLEKSGWMQQQGFYIEKSDTSYSAISRIEKVDKEIILFSVIKNSNPKIFKSIVKDDSKIVFENKDYKNPFQVTYEFIDENNYKRTITGNENDSLVVYEFNFKKVD